MPDREKVIKGLKCLITDGVPCNGCPYYGRGYCIKNIASDALDLLKEQDNRFDYLFSKFAGHSDYHGDSVLSAIDNVKNGKIIDNIIPNEDNFSNMKAKYNRLLKEQEAVSVKTDYVDGFGNPITNCPSCKSRLFWCSNKHYCGECGQPITWEGR